MTPEQDVARAAELLARGEPAVRVYRPDPTVAFGRLDTQRTGYAAAVEAARAHGFTPVLREPGGHAAAYHRGSLVVERFGPGGIDGVRERFVREAEAIVAALRSLGVDARLGSVPGEYCPGEFSVNLAGAAKLAGLAQRVKARAWMLGAELVVEDPEPVRAVLADVYSALDLPLDPATVAVPGPAIGAVERAIRGARDP